MSIADWDRMDAYTRDYGVRTVAYYAWPEPRYGIAFNGTAISTTDAAPAFASFAPASSSVFGDLNRNNPLEIVNSYIYLSNATPASGEDRVPLPKQDGEPGQNP